MPNAATNVETVPRLPKEVRLAVPIKSGQIFVATGRTQQEAQDQALLITEQVQREKRWQKKAKKGRGILGWLPFS